MPSASIRYDVSTGARLLRALPVVGGYLALVVFIFISMPEKGQKFALHTIALVGIIGMFRYTWVLTHCVRAALYEHYLYPKLRFQADQLPEESRMPKRIFFIIPTFGEKPEVSRQMLASVLDESAKLASEVIVIANAGSEAEDEVFRAAARERGQPANVELRYVRQIGGKRLGMATCIASLMNETIHENDVVILMDGDTVLGEGILDKCLPLFAAMPKLGAVTTDNISVTKGNWMYRMWYTMRFSMRHRMMKSQSLSRQLLVLTGRFSVFRAKECLTHEFISYLENDRIKHWLHGEIKFVTGDDKSTWFCLLNRGCEMLYVPDAHIFCMEDSGPEPVTQSIKKMHRWFGNMLRNNGRAIKLGPGRQRPFIWWCSIDQRISIFTSLLGPTAAIWAACSASMNFLAVYVIIVILSRLAYVLILTIEGHRMSFMDIPMLLYTQWVGSAVKVYTMFHLHKQKWDTHRETTDQRDRSNQASMLDELIPKMQIAFSVSLLVLVVTLVVGHKT